MEELLEFVPEDKREAFKAKATESGYTKLTDDIAFERVSKSQSLRDKIATPVAETALRNFNERKLPELIAQEREKIRKEFAPKEETAEQKELREMREWKAQMETEKQTNERKDTLRKKAGELGYDPLKAERLYAMPDAEDFLTTLAAEEKERKAKFEELEKKLKYGTNPPPAQTGGGHVMTEAEFVKLDPKAQAAFMAKPGARLE